MKKIMFNDKYGLTDAVLRGCKTMTRRFFDYEKPKKQWDEMCRLGTPCYSSFEDFLIKKVSKYKVGEEVAVAQKYWDLRNCNAFYETLAKADPYFPLECIKYEKGCNNKMFVKAQWMPHRIRITGIKVERLQDIREEDCLREGIKKMEGGMPYRFDDNGKVHLSADPRMLFADLIDRISGRGTWQSNPWVYVYTFELIK